MSCNSCGESIIEVPIEQLVRIPIKTSPQYCDVWHVCCYIYENCEGEIEPCEHYKKIWNVADMQANEGKYQL